MNGSNLVAESVGLERGGRPVLHNITAAFERGRATAIVGPSGSGKSSLLRCFNRLDEPNAGRILLDGVDTREIPPAELRRRVGLIGQTPIVFPGGVRANLGYGLHHSSDEQFVAALKRAGLAAEFLERQSDALSLGEAQRVCIARALVRDPEILLMDEPTSALDRDSVRTVEELIVSLAGQDLTVILVTHDLGLARKVAFLAKLMVDGYLRAEGTIEQVEAAWPGESP